MGVINKRKHSPAFKLDVALNAIESKAFAETARKYGLNTGQISKWVAHLKTHGSAIFSTTPDKEKLALQSKLGKLEQLVGKKEIELSLMKNFLDFENSQNGK